ncbi:hypothetical protein [Cellulomonas sp. Leaf334]|uniref:hypothetical protein n=1 Tax=Cellulomonas sp. Leaf334 TaxID=1736339 RepID=UPI0006F6D2A5|nr:hypothetical protein [Cellulomonas sp. Leaf334]KQR12027.1 hypothetical protein ASF78_12650 [Cellulomonas sp. Leaf334]
MASTNVRNDVIAQDAPERKKRKRAAIVRFGLVGAALVGIGAAATSAAWTDDAWFSATATAATIELEGSLDTTPRTWDVADDEVGALEIPAEAFADLVPGEVREYIVHVQNAGSVDITVAAPVWTPSTTDADLFAAPAPVTVTLSQTAPFTLEPGDSGDVTVTMTAPSWTNAEDEYQGASGSGTIRFTGTVGS